MVSEAARREIEDWMGSEKEAEATFAAVVDDRFRGGHVFHWLGTPLAIGDCWNSSGNHPVNTSSPKRSSHDSRRTKRIGDFLRPNAKRPAITDGARYILSKGCCLPAAKTLAHDRFPSVVVTWHLIVEPGVNRRGPEFLMPA